MIAVDGSSEAEHAVREVGMRVWPKGTEVRIIAVDDGTSPKRIARVLPTAVSTALVTKAHCSVEVVRRKDEV